MTSSRNSFAASKVKVALLDMYEQTPNLGMGNLRQLLGRFEKWLQWQEFEVRCKHELPGLDHDIYIFSGGPGNPLEGDPDWFEPYHRLIQNLYDYNRAGGQPPKFAFFICHSFQMACDHFGIGTISKRREKSFGIFPVYKTEQGKRDELFELLPDPFWVGDFREYQVIRPDMKRMKSLGIQLLCIEQMRKHPGLERAMMAVRFSPYMVGTQFHPEADPEGMRKYFCEEDRIKAVIEEYGEAAYFEMIENLKDPSKLARTFEIVLPVWLRRSVEAVRHFKPVTP